MKKTLSRRQFIAHAGSGIALGSLFACSDSPSPERYNEQDRAGLLQQRLVEEQRAGQGRFAQQRYRGYRGLAELPWFNLDSEGRLQCDHPDVPLAIDVHCHLGMSLLFKPHLDLLQSTPRVQHLLDCDGTAIGCELDLDVYANSNFTPSMLKTLRQQIRAQGLWGSSYAATQTIPNLVSEMTAMRVEQTWLLPIELGFWFGDDLTQQWRSGVSKLGVSQRVRTGFSIDPTSSDRIERMRYFAGQGLKLVKLHPTVQRFYPDDERAMEVYAEAERLGVIVFFHGGRAGIEPEAAHPFAMPRHYQAALREFPQVQFVLGHAGARDHEAMMNIALAHDNAWIDTHGQSVSNLDALIERTGGERLLFGSDWPFYHIGMSLAKVLITTEDPGRRGIRAKILRENAIALLRHQTTASSNYSGLG